MTFEPGPETRRRWYAVSVGIVVFAAVGLVTALALLVGGVGRASSAEGVRAGAAHGHRVAPVAEPGRVAEPGPAKPARFLTVQQLAAAIGCTPVLGGKAADFRQASCTPEGARRVVLVDFDTVDGQRTWLELSQDYGGYYLVGVRWAVSGNSKTYLEELSGTLGGAVEEGDVH